jgi:hypothetical protein
MPAVLAALPQLQCLDVVRSRDKQGVFAFAKLQHPLRIKSLCLEFYQDQPEQAQHLDQLSALVDLEHLSLSAFPLSALPDGLPSQLTKLTSLRVNYTNKAAEITAASGLFKHLGSLTALQSLDITWSSTEGLGQAWSGIGDLSRLTRLELKSATPALPFTAASIRSWTELTALESLTLHGCAVQPAALAAFTQLRALRSVNAQPLPNAKPQDLVSAVSELQLLTDLHAAWLVPKRHQVPELDAFTALTVSTDLRSLQVTQLPSDRKFYGGTVQLFKPDMLYPHLQLIDLAHTGSSNLRLSRAQLELLCSCCPAVQSLMFALQKEPSAAACLPLLQLTALTCLHVCGLDTRPASAAAVEAVAQLTGLQQLSLSHLNQLQEQLMDYSLLKLTALTALAELQLRGRITAAFQHMRNTVRGGCVLPDGQLPAGNSSGMGIAEYVYSLHAAASKLVVCMSCSGLLHL